MLSNTKQLQSTETKQQAGHCWWVTLRAPVLSKV